MTAKDSPKEKMESSTRKIVPSKEEVLEAAERIKRYVHFTKKVTCKSVDDIAGASLFFKPENLQKVGAFKFRGACNAVFSLSEEEAFRGVLTHSSGNHAQALALAARTRGIPAYIVMPETAPKVKVAAVKGYGGRITFCKPTLAAREETAARVMEETGAAFIHPYNDGRIIAGQATAAKELLDEVPDLDYLIAPVGGGGLLSGTALAAKYFAPGVTVYGAEPLGADDAARSLKAGVLIPSEGPKTIADGLLTSLGDLTFSILKEELSDIFTVAEESIVYAMSLIWERMKLVVEPSGAVPLAAVLERAGVVFGEGADGSSKTGAGAGAGEGAPGENPFAGKRVGIIISGGNVDLGKLPF